jgi:hypothetical protein
MLTLLAATKAFYHAHQELQENLQLILQTAKTPEELVDTIHGLARPRLDLNGDYLVMAVEEAHFKRFGKVNDAARKRKAEVQLTVHPSPFQSTPNSQSKQSTQQSTEQPAQQPAPFDPLAGLPRVVQPESTGAVPPTDSPLFTV